MLGTTTLRRLGTLTMIAVLGWAMALAIGNPDIVNSQAYRITASSLLFIGLYAAVLGINHTEAKKEWPTVLTAITFGVLCKYVFIFGATFALTQRWEYAVLAMAVAQIDPLSIAALEKDRRMSKRTHIVLRMWASFDDPITAVAAPLLIFAVAAMGSTHIEAPAKPGIWLLAIVGGIMAAICILQWLQRRHHNVAKLQIALLAGISVVTVATGSFPLAALAGWFIRPKAWDAEAGDATNQHKAAKRTALATEAALTCATFMLGMLLANGVDWYGGAALGFAAFASQGVATVLVLAVAGPITRRQTNAAAPFTKHEKWHLALGQQNGITAIILALNLAPHIPNAPAIVAVAIVIANLCNYGGNWLLGRHNV